MDKANAIYFSHFADQVLAEVEKIIESHDMVTQYKSIHLYCNREYETYRTKNGASIYDRDDMRMMKPDKLKDLLPGNQPF